MVDEKVPFSHKARAGRAEIVALMPFDYALSRNEYGVM